MLFKKNTNIALNSNTGKTQIEMHSQEENRITVIINLNL